MQQDTRLARLLHVLVHMHLRGGSTTSETIAQMLHTNASLVRRTMACLRNAGYVKAERGPGGGWHLSCSLEKVTVKDIHTTLLCPNLFTFGPTQDNPACPVEAVVNQHLKAAMDEAENTMLKVMGKIKLSDLVTKMGSMG